MGYSFGIRIALMCCVFTDTNTDTEREIIPVELETYLEGAIASLVKVKAIGDPADRWEEALEELDNAAQLIEMAHDLILNSH